MHLNPARRGTRFLLASPQRLHAAVLSGFPPAAAEPRPGRVLWRLDRATPELTLYVSSPARPDLTHLVEQAGWPTTPDPWQSASLAPLLDRLGNGQRWVFRLTANPVRSVRTAEGKRGKPFAHVTVEQQEDWLRTRAAGCGFAPDAFGVTERRRESFGRAAGERRDQVSLSTARYDGVLVVTDVDALRRSLVDGIGRAKGYGCGLLTLAPAR